MPPQFTKFYARKLFPLANCPYGKACEGGICQTITIPFEIPLLFMRYCISVTYCIKREKSEKMPVQNLKGIFYPRPPPSLQLRRP